MKSLLSVTSINVNGTVYLKKKCFHLVHKVQILTGDTPQMEWSERKRWEKVYQTNESNEKTDRILILNSVGLKTKSIKWDKERYFSMLKVVIHLDDVRIRNTDILNTTFTNQKVKEKQT